MAKILKIFYFEIMNHNVNINHKNREVGVLQRAGNLYVYLTSHNIPKE